GRFILTHRARMASRADQPQPVPPDIDQRLRLDRQTNDRTMRALQSIRHSRMRNERHIGRFDAAIGEEKARWGLRTPRYADQDHVRFGEPRLSLAIVVL